MIDSNDKWKPVRWNWFVVVFLIACIAIGFTAGRANAHHGSHIESVQRAQYRDAIYTEACDRFRFEGLSPDKAMCNELLRATHKVKRDGRKADRTWVSNKSLLKLLKKESSYRHRAINPSSGACGMGQMLPCDKYGPGSCWPHLRKQARCFIRYILGRYGTPEKAWYFWRVTSVRLTGNHWY